MAGHTLAKTIRVEGLFPLPLDALWRLLHAHVDDEKILEIHPWILSGRTIREADPIEYRGVSFPRVKVAERVVRIGGRSSSSVWTYRIEPPKTYKYDVSFANGSHMRFENSYRSATGGTLVQTTGWISIVRVPSLLARWVAKRSLERADQEDLAYARKQDRR